MRMRAGYRACGSTRIFTAVGDDPLGFPALARTGKYTRETLIAQTPKPPELSLKPLPRHGPPLRLKRKSERYPQ
jgi:hypothetical protein